MGTESAELLTGLLKSVSRSFYLTLRVLPGAIRPQIGLAYLLARATDTIADTDAVPKARRLAVLTALHTRIAQGTDVPLDLSGFTGEQSSVSERHLLQRLGEATALLDAMEPADRDRVRTVLAVIVSGQSLDVERFAGADAAHIQALGTDAELDDYTYRVAGCVGEFWTRMCRMHLFPHAALDDALLFTRGVQFGKGLQLVNVLRDLPGDLRHGRCYLPKEQLDHLGLEPADLLDPRNEARLRPAYDRFLDQADDHLAAGWDYTNSLPFRCVRVRLACAWPILIGIQTLAALRKRPILDPNQRVKVSRRSVRNVLAQTLLYYPWPWAWRRLGKHRGPPRRNTLPQGASFAK